MEQTRSLICLCDSGVARCQSLLANEFDVRASELGSCQICVFHGAIKLLGHWLDMVYLPPRGNFVDHIFLVAQCLARILQHVSPLTMAALSCNILLHTLPHKIFDN